MLTWQRRNAESTDRQRRVWSTTRQEETRQQYVNACVAEFQRSASKPIPFEILRYVFVGCGMRYDRGARLSDKEGAA